jgi:hypothetical protein
MDSAPSTTHYSLLTTHHSLPTTHYPLPTNHYPLTHHFPCGAPARTPSPSPARSSAADRTATGSIVSQVGLGHAARAAEALGDGFSRCQLDVDTAEHRTRRAPACPPRSAPAIRCRIARPRGASSCPCSTETRCCRASDRTSTRVATLVERSRFDEAEAAPPFTFDPAPKRQISTRRPGSRHGSRQLGQRLQLRRASSLARS